jgi:hypothetical protein
MWGRGLGRIELGQVELRNMRPGQKDLAVNVKGLKDLIESLSLTLQNTTLQRFKKAQRLAVQISRLVNV